MMKLYYLPLIYKEEIILENSIKIVETPYFKEYIRTDTKGLFIRVPVNLKDGDECLAFLEPQTNISRTIKDNMLYLKLQITIIGKNPFRVGYRTIFTAVADIDHDAYDLFFERINIDKIDDYLYLGCQKKSIMKILRGGSNETDEN